MHHVPFYAKGNLSRAAAVEIMGEGAVNCAERENCEPTSRRMQAGAEDLQEWVASYPEGKYLVCCWYYPEDFDFVGDDGEPLELDQVQWKIQGYSVEEL